MRFELAVQDPAGVMIAGRVAPDRVELCSALGTGGLTPSAGLIDLAVGTGVPVHVLVRPREGGFAYDDDERAAIVADVRHAFRSGAAGVVVGGLCPDGTIDLALLDRVLEASDGGDVTFHRAFDTVTHRRAAIEALAARGVRRVLTSGGASRAIDALDVLRATVDQAAGGIEVMAGAGVTSANVAAIAETAVHAVHASAKRSVVEQLPVTLGAQASAGASARATTDETEANAIRDAVRRVRGA